MVNAQRARPPDEPKKSPPTAGAVCDALFPGDISPRGLERVPEPFGSREYEIPCEFRRHSCPCSRSSLNYESDRTKGESDRTKDTDFHREGYSDPLKLSCGL